MKVSIALCKLLDFFWRGVLLQSAAKKKDGSANPILLNPHMHRIACGYASL